LEAEAAASKKKEAGEYDVVVRQLQFEMKAKVRCIASAIFTLISLITKVFFPAYVL